MVTLENIIRQDTKYNFVKNDVFPYIVKGRVQYDMNKQMTSMDGSITDTSGNHIASFNSYGELENNNFRCNLNDCDCSKFNEAASLLNETIIELRDIQL
jgi:hypothetical protein